MRDLLLVGELHYREFLASQERIATNVLADRLARLHSCGIIEKTTDDPRSGKQTYHPTDKGRDLIPVLLELMSWSDRHDAGAIAPPELVDAYRADRDGVAAGLREAPSVASYLKLGTAELTPLHQPGGPRGDDGSLRPGGLPRLSIRSRQPHHAPANPRIAADGNPTSVLANLEGK